MIFIVLAALLFTFAPPLRGMEEAAEPRKLVRVQLENRRQAEELLALDLDFASHGFSRHADIIVTAGQEEMLVRQGFTVKTLAGDLKQLFAQRFGGVADMGAYHTYQEMYDEMLAISQSHPNITRLLSIGQSLEGREIWAMKVSDNPMIEEDDEPDLLYMANMHAREVVTPEIILFFLNHLVQNYGVDAQVTELVDNREFWLIPTQNPDGHMYVENVNAWWRKNRRNNGNGSFGVDLNRNYGYQWGFDNIGSSPNPFSETYRGTGPFSEPESQAIRELCIARDFVIALSFHSYGNLWLFPWGYVPENTPHHEIFVEMANQCVAFNGYAPGNPASGTIYLTNGDTDDYFYGEQTEKNLVFSFTPEVGNEFWPPESQIPILTQENLGPMLYLAEIADIVADNPWRLLRPATPVIDPFAGIEDGNYEVSWTINDDPNNPAVAFQLDELSGYSTLTDNAENGAANFSLDGFNLSTARFRSGSRSFYSGQGDGMNVNMTTSAPLLVSAGNVLTFWTWYSIESNWDYAYVEVSTNGVAFQSIPGNLTTNSNPNGTNLGNGITGSSGGWIQGIFNLNAFSGQSIYVRFRYVTDAAIIQEGFYVDDITPTPRFESIETLADDITENTFAISGREPGIYFYRVRARDAEEQWGGWSALEEVTVEDGDVTVIYDFPQGGWYAISLPVIPPDSSLSVLFPDALAAFTWDGANQMYLLATELEPTKAYWLLMLEAAVVEVLGVPLNSYKKNFAHAGWYMIGSVIEPCPVIDDPPGSLLAMFCWDPVAQNYFPINPLVMEPKQGCWIMIYQSPSVITVGCDSASNVNPRDKGRVLPAFYAALGAMPPPPPFRQAQSEPFALPESTPEKIPEQFGLSQNYPNPFNSSTERSRRSPETVIEYQLPEARRVSLKIYDVTGREVRTLIEREMPAGFHRAIWDGRDGAGQALKSSVYFYRLTAGEYMQTKKILFVR